MSKYKNVPVTIDGMRFASKEEYGRYRVLSMLEKTGEITGLRCQAAIELAPAVRLPGAERKTPALRYVADFSYTDKWGRTIYEDVKGAPLTPVYKIKRHLLAVRGIYIVEIRA